MTSDEMFKAIHELRMRQLHSPPTAEDIQLMEKIVLSGDEGSRMYVRYMQDEASLVWSSSRDLDGDSVDDGSGLKTLSDAMILPAIQETESETQEQEHAAPIAKYIAQRPAWHLPKHWLLGLALAAAMLVSLVLVTVLLSSHGSDQHQTVATKIVESPALLEAAVDAQWDTTEAGPQIGDHLPRRPSLSSPASHP